MGGHRGAGRPGDWSADDEQTLVRRLLPSMAERGRLCLLILLGAFLFPLITDWMSGFHGSAAMRWIEIGRILLLAVLLLLLRPGLGERTAALLTLGGLAVLSSSAAVVCVMRGDLGPYLIVTGCTSFGCSVGLPWRPRHQATLALLFALCLAAALPFVADGAWALANQNSILSFLLSLVVAIVMTSMETQRRRATVEAVDRTVRSGEALRELNENLEQRVDSRTAELADANRELEGANVRLARTNRDLEAAYRELEAFTHSVSHDLRVPLRVINGLSRVALEEHGAGIDDDVRGYLQRIGNEAIRLGEIGDDLLTLARVSRTPIVPVAVDVSRMAREVTDELRASDPLRRTDVRIDAGLQVVADPDLLLVVLEQLLSNAWKFTRQRESAAIEIARYDGDGRSGFLVRDNGNGFDPEFAGKLFLPFERIHDDDVEGRGVGLAIAQRIVVRHGGQIRAEGKSGGGATFFVSLPLHPGPTAAGTGSRTAGYAAHES